MLCVQQEHMVRTTVASLLSIVILFVGVFAISESAQQSKGTAMNSSNASADAWNTSVGVFEGMGQASQGIVWFGVAAVVVVALGFLVFAGASGGR